MPLLMNDCLSNCSATNPLEEIREELRQIREQQAMLLQSVNFCSNKISDFENELSKLKEHLKKTDQILNENKKLKSDLVALQTKVNDLDQASRSNNLEIQGIPEKRNEDLLNIVEKIGAYINYNVTPHTVDYALRVQSNHNSSDTTSKNIIVKFTFKKERDLFLMAVKTKRIRNNNSAKMSLDGISDASIYINEHLTLANKLLYKDVRAAARDKQYKYVWVKNGVIFCRKDDSSRIIAIKSQELLEKM
ncbi:uncharacterized protein [Leptinotarsa decemlineata]|uniref:uncharacterized protein n=1 Tax=Leptinotarsa decemlineata TaxID=7539 RepID=UPI003D3052C5